MNKYLSLFVLAGVLGMNAMAADYTCVGTRVIGVEKHTFTFRGLLITGHKGEGKTRGEAISEANNNCLASHNNCRVSCFSTDDEMSASEE